MSYFKRQFDNEYIYPIDFNELYKKLEDLGASPIPRVVPNMDEGSYQATPSAFNNALNALVAMGRGPFDPHPRDIIIYEDYVNQIQTEIEAILVTPTGTGQYVYVSPTGTASYPGTRINPASVQNAKSGVNPGDVVLFLPGTYDFAAQMDWGRSGSAGNWITLVADDGPGSVTLRYTASRPADSNLSGFLWQFGGNYYRTWGLIFDGQNNNKANLKFQTTKHHYIVDKCEFYNAGTAGVAAVTNDYVTVMNCRVHHCGYYRGWSSGISLNHCFWLDAVQAFHNFLINNVISGCFDNSPAIPEMGNFGSNPTDGNGIIMDLAEASDITPGDSSIPYTLIANNHAYMNGGKGIHTLNVDNCYIFQNTCYKNGLDNRNTWAEFNMTSGAGNWFVNNVAQGWPGRNNPGYRFATGNGYAAPSNYHYHGNSYFDATISTLPAAVQSDSSMVRSENPQFANPHSVSGYPDGLTAPNGQYSTAPTDFEPTTGPRYLPAAGSGLLLSGVAITDANLAALGVPSFLRADIRKYCGEDRRFYLRDEDTPTRGVYERAAGNY